jgi:hypothetical protein
MFSHDHAHWSTLRFTFDNSRNRMLTNLAAMLTSMHYNAGA